MRICGLTSMRTFLAEWMNTCSLPALFKGLSSSISKHYTRKPAISVAGTITVFEGLSWLMAHVQAQDNDLMDDVGAEIDGVTFVLLEDVSVI